MQTHEKFVQAVACIVAARLGATDRAKVEAIKLVYGAGETGLRGVTYFQRWKATDDIVPFVEVCAFGQESWIQLAGTTIHELGHVLAGMGRGHDATWKAACEAMGLRKVKAAGTQYHLASFTPDIRNAIAALDKPDDGAPVISLANNGLFGYQPMKACPAGIGTRGGKSRGKGSGSRLRLWQCGCGCKVRVSSDNFQAKHLTCNTLFARA